MPQSIEFERGNSIDGKFEVVDQLEASPLGRLYRVRETTSGTYRRLLMFRPRVADKDAKEQVIRAFQDARGLRHDNLATVLDLGDHEGNPYLLMEDFDGGTLRDLLQTYKVEGRPFDVKEAAQITIQILEGIEAAAAKGHQFRGLRPEHVFVNVKRIGPRKANFVADVELVGSVFWDLVPSATLAEDEFSRGEAQYLAPELKSFEPKATERSDVYSAGVMFYEMVVGTAPVGTFQLPRTRRPDLPEHVNNVAELALAHSPDDRYPTARDFIMDIQRIFDGSAIEETARRGLLTPLLIVALMMALVVVVLAAVILFNLAPDPVKTALAEDVSLRKQMRELTMENKPSVEEVRTILERHPRNMAFIAGGPYLAGASRMEVLDDIARPGEPVNAQVVVEPFLIDLFEFPNLKGADPTLELTHAEAQTACESVGKRLCTANEWEKACKGPSMKAYAYGDTYDAAFCGDGLEDVAPLGSRSECRTDYSVFDMSGNFREWTATPRSGSTTRFMVKDGLRSSSAKGTRCAYAKDENAAFSDKTIGFRCCRDASAPPFVPPAEDEKDQ